jgi:hypothetical protein
LHATSSEPVQELDDVVVIDESVGELEKRRD